MLGINGLRRALWNRPKFKNQASYDVIYSLFWTENQTLDSPMYIEQQEQDLLKVIQSWGQVVHHTDIFHQPRYSKTQFTSDNWQPQTLQNI